jgi:mono/diheme cytochrome c family protein
MMIAKMLKLQFHQHMNTFAGFIARGRIRAVVLWLVILVATLALTATGLFLCLESRWFKPEPLRTPQHAFLSGAIGTELIPLSILEVLPDLFPDKFPGNEEWVKKYGFVAPKWRQQLVKSQNQSDLQGVGAEGLPLGFTVSRLRPLSAFPSPVDFVGFGCATCHSTTIREHPGDSGIVVLGPGNSSLNLLAFFENFKAALLEQEVGADAAVVKPRYVLTAAKVSAQQRKHGKQLGILDELVITGWLTQARAAVEADSAANDEPRTGADLYDSQKNRAGPMRSTPFRSLVHSLLNRPGRSALRDDLDMSFVKFGTVFNQHGKEWAQFDGSVRKLYSRSALAALSAGATIQSLSNPEIMRSIMESSDYVGSLQSPGWDEVFPAAKIDPAKAQRGLIVYRQHCSTCHGYRETGSGKWVAETQAGTPDRLGEVIKPGEIQTDAERLTFAHLDRLPQAFHDFFEKLPFGVTEGLPFGHPFALAYDPQHPADGEIRAATGYINSPLPGVFLRAPYLHNASVLTVRELINLDPRRTTFQRGSNLYDTARVGLKAPATAEPGFEWKYDTTLPGNSNRGHDYPWPYSETLSPERRQQLEDLLEYVKTL